jgi:hypothetical protein
MDIFTLQYLYRNLYTWVFINTIIPFLLREKWENILVEIPIAFSTVLAILGGVVLVYQVAKMLSEVKKYVIA